MKILIADDERLVRVALISMIEELQTEHHEIVEAKNGAQLAQMAAEFLPDLAFVDISMPVCSGLEGIERCRAQTPNTLWVILTCFAEFGYAQDAIRLGASNYLLKPIDTARLQDVLTLAQEHTSAREQKNNRHFRAQCAMLYNISQYEEPECESMDGTDGALFSVYVLSIDDKPNASRAQADEIMRLIRSKAQRLSGVYVSEFFTATGEICVIAAGEKSQLQAVTQLFEEICALSSSEQAFTVLTDCGKATLIDAVSAVDRLCKLMALRCLGGFGGMTASSEWKESGSSDALFEMAAEVDDIVLAFNRRKEGEYARCADKLCELFKAFGWAEGNYLEGVKKYFSVTIGLAPSKATLRDALIKHADRMYSAQPKQEVDIADAICAFVDENYHSDIGVNTLADTYGITPNYLSRVFKQKTGMRFIDYLTQTRINNAKRILTEEPDLSIKEVSERVGYFSQRHFTKLFQKITGANPSRFKEAGGKL